MPNEKQSILVVGSTGHKNATKCIQWGEELVYVGDYDYLIFDTTSLNEETLKKIIQSDNGYFNKLRKDIADVQQNKGVAITCILSPYIFDRQIGSSERSIKDFLSNTTNNYSWSPIIPVLERIPTGEKINKESSNLPEEYLKAIKGYDVLYDSEFNNTGYVDRNREKGIFTNFRQKSLLKNNVSRDIAFAIGWKVCQNYDYNVIVDGNLPIEFLPPTQNTREGIDILINEFCKEPEESMPDWISEIILPGEKEIKGKINAKIGEIDLVNGEIKELESELLNTTLYKKLLYAQGLELEDIVEKSLFLLGVELKKPDITNIEDRFYETSDKQKIYFEIRGVNRLMGESDLAQLIKRIAEKPVSTDYKARGVFVFNHQNKTNLQGRDRAFHHNIEMQAKSFSLCLLDTCTLFNLVKNKMENNEEIDLREELFNTVGVFRITDKEKTD
jgi:hypothetical protein